MMRPLLLLTLTVFAASCRPESQRASLDLPEGAEAISLLGDTLRAPTLPDAVLDQREEDLTNARAAFDADPDDPDALIWLGRRTAYLGRYREAIEIFSRGVEQFPEDARMLRHRGHRFITTRQLDRAVDDLELAASMIEGNLDEIEPDGQPNAAGIPTSTLHTNIWYHLALAHYLRGDFEAALRAYERCLDASSNPDMAVATIYWLYLTLHRLGQTSAASNVVATVDRDLELLENHAYHRLILLFKGDMTLDEIGSGDDPLGNATDGYGISMWHRMQGREAEATRALWSILAGTEWAAFGFIAAEAEVARMTRE